MIPNMARYHFKVIFISRIVRIFKLNKKISVEGDISVRIIWKRFKIIHNKKGIKLFLKNK